AFGAAEWNAAELLPLLQELKACGAVEPASQFGNALGDLVLCFGNEFGCGRWRGRAQIGDEIGDSEVGFVTNRRDHRQSAACNAAGHALAVERGQIFERPAAAGHHDEVDEATSRVKIRNGHFNFRGRRFSLYADRVEQHTKAGVAAIDDVQKVANDGAGWRCDDAYATRESRQRPLTFSVKETFGLEPF